MPSGPQTATIWILPRCSRAGTVWTKTGYRRGICPGGLSTHGWIPTLRTLRSLGLEPGALRAFRRPDIVAEVKDLAAEQVAAPSYYITVEASYTVCKRDVVRTTDNAKIVREITGLVAYPVVAGVELDDRTGADTHGRLYDDLDRFIEANDADAAFWYRLESADLRPSEPE